MAATELLRRLQAGDPSIHANASRVRDGVILFGPLCLKVGEPELIGRRTSGSPAVTSERDREPGRAVGEAERRLVGRPARPRLDLFGRQVWWLIPLWVMTAVLALAILATLVMSLHLYRDGIIVYDRWTVGNYTRFLFDPYYLRILGTTTFVGGMVVLLTLALGYFPAYLIARAERWKGLMLALTISPILLPAVIRAFLMRGPTCCRGPKVCAWSAARGGTSRSAISTRA